MISTGVFTIANAFFPPFTLITSDGVWDAEEVEAIYGVHHVYSQKKSKVAYAAPPPLFFFFACDVLRIG